MSRSYSYSFSSSSRPGRTNRATYSFPAGHLDYGADCNLIEYDNQGDRQGERLVDKALLRVLDVDFNVASNAQAHHTDRYEMTEDRYDFGMKCPAQLVVRRGQPFTVTIFFERPFDQAKDDINLVFSTGEHPDETKGTMIRMLLSDQDIPGKWGAKIQNQNGKELTLVIFTPPKAIVAKWDFKFDTVSKKGDERKVFRYTHPHPFYMLFNPWCPEDTVFMDDELAREEYVLNDKGRVYQGAAKQIHSKPWNFGQFEDFMLDCCMFLLDLAEMRPRNRANPVLVARKISAIANSPDDNGVLVGNWSGDYSGGMSPTRWIGSVRILEQFWKTREPVKYGQCWVFSGVVTTICRCLGLPARSVTNFASAHDCDESITIDCHWTYEGKPIHEMNADSVWNFHVWNDVWMARPDLPPGFGGWQAIDATPQETSDGVYCAGPASVEAIKNGLVNMPYDGPFIFAEVNADKVHWIQKPDGGWTNTKETHCVGKMISTKSPMNDDRQDVTLCYKFKEGTQAERTATYRAAAVGSVRDDVYNDLGVEDMAFDLVEKDNIMIGQPFDVTLKITNRAKVQHVCSVTLTATSVHYTGVKAKEIKSMKWTQANSPAIVPAQTATEVTMSVTPDEYMDKLVELCCIEISCSVWVKETNQYHCESDDFRLVKPQLEFKAPKEVTVGKEYEVEMSFKNPLSCPLTQCEFTLEGASLQKPMILKHASVPPNGKAKVTAKLTARKPGFRELIAEFDSKELGDVIGLCHVKVKAQR